MLGKDKQFPCDCIEFKEKDRHEDIYKEMTISDNEETENKILAGMS